VKAVVVGAGHNGLVCACYLAQAGLDVLVLEQALAPGGGSTTRETVPGYRFDTHSVAHNIINMTPVPEELGLAEAGLCYREMDPFATALFADGRIVRFHRSITRTVASIAEHDPAEAAAYEAFMEVAAGVLRPALAALRAGGGAAGARRALRHLPQARRAVAGQLADVAAELLGPYRRTPETRLCSDLTRGPVAAFAAHASAAPATPAGGLFAYWQAAYHLFGQWHAVGGSGALTDALVRRLESLARHTRCNAPVARIDARAGCVRGVTLEDGERIAAGVVIAAIDPKVALLHLLDPPLAEREGRRLAATHRANTVQAVISRRDRPAPPLTPARAPATGTASRAPSTRSTGWTRRSPRPRRAACRTRRPPTRSPPRPWMPGSARPATTLSTWPVRLPHSLSGRDGRPPARAWPRT